MYMEKTTEIASLIYWNNGVTKDEVDTVIRELIRRRLVHSETTREYNPNYGGPVWYIP